VVEVVEDKDIQQLLEDLVVVVHMKVVAALHLTKKVEQEIHLLLVLLKEIMVVMDILKVHLMQVVVVVEQEQ
tara:strand:+ start:224 stop:439 length:216 start_codon:yes stop_codon:yes gene_type:complete